MDGPDNERLVVVETILHGGAMWMPPAIRRAVCYATQDLTMPVSFGEVIAVAGISKSHFCALARQTFGMGFMRFLMWLRTAKARDLLGTTGKPVTDICYEVGFGDLRQMQRAFQRLYGCTPTEYRLQISEHRRHMFLTEQNQTERRPERNERLTG